MFHSPVLIKAVEGCEAVAAIFAASVSVRQGKYVAEHWPDDHTTFLWWKGTIDGHGIESFDVIVDNDGRLPIAHCRPWSCSEKAMYSMRKDVLPADVWEYPER